MIQVTQPFLPPKEAYSKYLDIIWDNKWLTNMGPLSKELEQKLSEFLGVKQVLFVTNGTIALQMAIRALDLKGEIITTPFSFIATSSTIIWEGCKPVFADIDEQSLNIDPAKIEEKITPQTTAILATHVYGNPCDVLAIEAIARKHGLKVIYDAAHAFAVEINGKSIFEFGDLSICSLHATKLYHSVEGGLVVTNNDVLFQKIKHIRNFGFNGPVNFSEVGINGKNSEYHAAMGLVNLDYVPAIIERRKSLTEHYLERLNSVALRIPLWNAEATKNYAYFPVIIESEDKLTKFIEALQSNKIFPRRYFYPSLSSVIPGQPIVEMPVSDDISARILCLPLYYDLTKSEVDHICDVLIEVNNSF